MRPAGRRAAVISNANRLVPMPSDHGGRLENFQCVAHAGHQAIETSEHQPIDITEDKALRRLTPQHVELMAKDKDFCLQRRARPEQSDHKAPNQPEQIDQRTKYCPIRSQQPVD